MFLRSFLQIDNLLTTAVIWPFSVIFQFTMRLGGLLLGIGIPAKRITEESFSDEHLEWLSPAWAIAPRRWCRALSITKDTKDEDKIPGLMHNTGGYRVRDIEFVTAFDVDALKVGRTCPRRSEPQNNTHQVRGRRIWAWRCCAARPTTVWANTTVR